MTQSNSPLSLTDAAARQIRRITEGHPERTLLRVAVQGGGCSGFSYRFDFAEHCEDGDIVIERDGAKIVIDSASLPFLLGSSLDYSDELIGAAFRINNPNAVAACGCGVSFSI